MSGTRSVQPTGLSRSSLLRQSSILAGATTMSRATGFVRTSVWAAALGLYTVGGAFTIGNTIPTILYTMLAGGALTAVFVPQLVRAIAQGEEAGAAYADRLLTLTLTLLGVLTTVTVGAAPILATLYTGSGWSAADLALASALTAWCLPQIFFYGLFAVLGQVLHARDRPALMLWAPVANNVIAIAVGIAFIGYGTVDTGPGPAASESLSPAEVAFLGGGATLGVIAQALVLIPALRCAGFRYRPRMDLRGSGLGRSARLAGWTLLFVAANQVAFSITAVIANTAGKAAEASVGWAAGLPSYTNAYMIMLVPHAVVTVSVASALLPSMSRSAVQGRPHEVGAEVARGLLLAGRALVPIAAATLAVGPLVTRLVFFGNPADERFMGLVLAAFAPAIVVFSAQFLVIRGLHALEDTRTPAMIQLLITSLQVLTAILSAVLLPPGWVIVGIAAGFSAAYSVGLATSLAVLRRATRTPGGWRLRGPFGRWAATALPTAAVTVVAADALTALWGKDLIGSVAALALAAAVFALGYALLLRATRASARKRAP